MAFGINVGLNQASITQVKNQFNTLLKDLQQISDRNPIQIRVQLGQNQINQLNNQLNNLNSNVNNSNNNFKTMGSSLQSITGFFLKWTAAMIGANFILSQFKNGITDIVKMDTALTNLNKVVDMNISQMNNMKNSAIEMGKAMGASAVDIMNGFAEFGRVTKDLNEIKQLTQSAIVGSNVTDLSVEGASKALNTAMISYKVEAKDSMNLINQWNQIQNNFRTSAVDLADAIGVVGASAKQSGVPIQNLEGYITAIVSATGIKGSEAGTALKSFISRVYRIGSEGAEDAGKAEESLKKVGVSVRDQAGNFRNFNNIIEDTNSAFSKLSNAEQMATAQAIGGTMHYSKFLSLINNFEIATKATTAALNSQNSAMVENGKYLNSIEGKTKILLATIQEKFNNAISSDAIKGIVDGLTVVVSTFASLKTVAIVAGTAILWFKGTAILSTIQSLASFAISLASVVAQYGFTTIATAELSIAMNNLKLAFLSNPLGIVSVALTTIIGLFALAGKSASKSAEETTKAIQDQISSLKTQQTDIETLADTYDKLSKNTNKSTDEQQQYLDVQAKIAKISPEIVDHYTAEGSAVIKGTEAIKEYVNALKLQEIGKQKDLKDSYIDQIKAEIKEQKNLNEALKENKENRAGAIADNKVNNTGIDISIYNKDAIALNDKLQNSFTKTKIALEGLNSGVEDYVNLQGEAKVVADNMAKSMESQFNTKYNGSAEAYIKDFQKMVDTIKSNKLQEQFADYEKLNNEYKDGTVTLTELTKKYDALKLVLHTLGLNDGDIKKFLPDMGSVIDSQIANMEKLSQSVRDYESEQEKLEKAFHKSEASIKDLDDALTKMHKGQTLSAEDVSELIIKYPELASAVSGTSGAYKINEEALNNLRKAHVLETVVTLESQAKESKAVLDGVSERIKLYGIETDAIMDLASAKEQASKVSDRDIAMGAGESRETGLKNNQDLRDKITQLGKTKAEIKKLSELINDPTLGVKEDTSKSSGSQSSEKQENVALIEKERYFSLQQELTKVNNLLDENKALQTDATENNNLVEKIKLQQQELTLLSQKQIATKNIQTEQQKEREEKALSLRNSGVKFDGQYENSNPINSDIILQGKLDKMNAERNSKDKSQYNILKADYEDFSNTMKRFMELENTDIVKTKSNISSLSSEMSKVSSEIGKGMIDSLLTDTDKKITTLKDSIKSIGTIDTPIEFSNNYEILNTLMDTYKTQIKTIIDEESKINPELINLQNLESANTLTSEQKLKIIELRAEMDSIKDKKVSISVDVNANITDLIKNINDSFSSKTNSLQNSISLMGNLDTEKEKSNLIQFNKEMYQILLDKNKSFNDEILKQDAILQSKKSSISEKNLAQESKTLFSAEMIKNSIEMVGNLDSRAGQYKELATALVENLTSSFDQEIENHKNTIQFSSIFDTEESKKRVSETSREIFSDLINESDAVEKEINATKLKLSVEKDDSQIKLLQTELEELTKKDYTIKVDILAQGKEAQTRIDGYNKSLKDALKLERERLKAEKDLAKQMEEARLSQLLTNAGLDTALLQEELAQLDQQKQLIENGKSNRVIDINYTDTPNMAIRTPEEASDKVKKDWLQTKADSEDIKTSVDDFDKFLKKSSDDVVKSATDAQSKILKEIKALGTMTDTNKPKFEELFTQLDEVPLELDKSSEEVAKSVREYGKSLGLPDDVVNDAVISATAPLQGLAIQITESGTIAIDTIVKEMVKAMTKGSDELTVQANIMANLLKGSLGLDKGQFKEDAKETAQSAYDAYNETVKTIGVINEKIKALKEQKNLSTIDQAELSKLNDVKVNLSADLIVRKESIDGIAETVKAQLGENSLKGIKIKVDGETKSLADLVAKTRKDEEKKSIKLKVDANVDKVIETVKDLKLDPITVEVQADMSKINTATGGTGSNTSPSNPTTSNPPVSTPTTTPSTPNTTPSNPNQQELKVNTYQDANILRTQYGDGKTIEGINIIVEAGSAFAGRDRKETNEILQIAMATKGYTNPKPITDFYDKKFDTPKYATGTSGHQGGMAIVGDEEKGKGTREIAILPNGETKIIGEKGWTLEELPKGTQVIPNDETEKILSQGGIVPHYAQGTGSASPIITDRGSYILGYSGGQMDMDKFYDTFEEAKLAAEVINKERGSSYQVPSSYTGSDPFGSINNIEVNPTIPNNSTKTDTASPELKDLQGTEFISKTQAFIDSTDDPMKLDELYKKKIELYRAIEQKGKEAKDKLKTELTMKDGLVENTESNQKIMDTINNLTKIQLSAQTLINSTVKESFDNKFKLMDEEIVKNKEIYDEKSNDLKVLELIDKENYDKKISLNKDLFDLESKNQANLIANKKKLEDDQKNLKDKDGKPVDPKTSLEWITLDNQIKKVNTDIETSNYNTLQLKETITSTIKDNIFTQIDDAVKTMEESVSVNIKKLDDALNEAENRTSVGDTNKERLNTQKQLTDLMFNDSIEGKAKRLELEQKLSEETKKITSEKMKHDVDLRKKAMQEELDTNKKNIELAKTDIEDVFALTNKNVLTLDSSMDVILKKWTGLFDVLGEKIQGKIVGSFSNANSGVSLDTSKATNITIPAHKNGTLSALGGLTKVSEGNEGLNGVELRIMGKGDGVVTANLTNNLNTLAMAVPTLMDNFKMKLPDLSTMFNAFKGMTPVGASATNNYSVNVSVASMNGDKKSAGLVANEIITNIKKMGGKF